MGGLNVEWLFLKIYDLFTGKANVDWAHSGLHAFLGFVLSAISVFFLAVIFYSIMKLKDRRSADLHKLHHAIHDAYHSHEDHKENKRWQMILDFITSDKPSDWRLAIIEADTILDEITREKGFVGETLGERLQNAPASHFKTINSAWEAHKIRNRIAHEGLAYEIPYREAKKAIELYETVFEEFDYV